MIIAVTNLIFISNLKAEPIVKPADIHYSYIGKNSGLGELFYKNNRYFQCMTKRHCKQIAESDPRLKVAIFLKDKNSDMVIPSFLQCYRDGTGQASMAEAMVTAANNAIKNESSCLDLSQVDSNVPARFATDTMKAMQKFGGACPKEDRSCVGQIADLLEQDLKNAFNFFSKKAEGETTKMGCLSTMVSNLVESLYSTLKLFLYDAPKKVFEVGAALWNHFFDSEKESSTAMLYSSMMAPDMAQALADWDLAKFYSLLRSNFFELMGNIRKFYTELLGCTEWQGAPYESECLKKTNWSCPTCESVTNFACGLTGQLGTGMFLGGLLGTAKGIANVAQLQKAISLNPKSYGIPGLAIKEMKVKMGIDEAMKGAKEFGQRANYKVSKLSAPLVDVLSSVKDEIKVISGLGSGFKKIVSSNPVTLPYHITYQKMKGFMNKKSAEGMINHSLKGTENAINLGKRYALHLQNITEDFAVHAKQLYKIRGDKFNPTVYKEVMKDYISTVQGEMKRMGIKVEKIEGGTALKLEKNGEIFEYRPDFRDKLESGSKYSLEEFKTHVSNQDPLLYNGKIPGYNPESPGFLSDIIQKANTSKGLFVTQADAMDGYIYLGHFSTQQSLVPKIEDCNDYLEGIEYLEMHDISDEK